MPVTPSRRQIDNGGIERPDANRPQFRGPSGALMTDYGVDPTESYLAALDPSTDTSKSYALFGRPGEAQYAAGQMRGLGAVAQTMGPVQANMAGDNAARGFQQSALSGFRQAMSGGGPSVAGLQAQAGIDGGAARANMAAASASPMQRAGAARAGILAGSGMGLAAAQNAGLERAQEVATARGGFGSTAGQMRGADANAAFQQAGLAMQNRQLNDQRQNAYEGLGQSMMDLQFEGSQRQLGGIRAIHQLGTEQAMRDQALANADNERRQNLGLGVMQAGIGMIPIAGQAGSAAVGAGKK